MNLPRVANVTIGSFLAGLLIGFFGTPGVPSVVIGAATIAFVCSYVLALAYGDES